MKATWVVQKEKESGIAPINRWETQDAHSHISVVFPAIQVLFVQLMTSVLWFRYSLFSRLLQAKHYLLVAEVHSIYKSPCLHKVAGIRWQALLHSRGKCHLQTTATALWQTPEWLKSCSMYKKHDYIHLRGLATIVECSGKQWLQKVQSARDCCIICGSESTALVLTETGHIRSCYCIQ